jgi:hypothetical protein
VTNTRIFIPQFFTAILAGWRPLDQRGSWLQANGLAMGRRGKNANAVTLFSTHLLEQISHSASAMVDLLSPSQQIRPDGDDRHAEQNHAAPCQFIKASLFAQKHHPADDGKQRQ